MDLYEDLGCGAAGTLWPRAGTPGPTWQYLGTLTLDAAPPSLDVSVVAQVQGDAPPPPGPPAGPVPLPLETAYYARGGPPPLRGCPEVGLRPTLARPAWPVSAAVRVWGAAPIHLRAPADVPCRLCA